MAFTLRHLSAVLKHAGIPGTGALQEPPVRSASRHRGVTPLLQIGLACIGMIVCSMPLPGQTATGGAREFTVLAGGEAEWAGVAYQRTATEPVALTFAHQRRSEALKAAGGDALVFTRERIDPTTGKPVRVTVAKAAWPSGVRTALLVFAPRATAGADGIEFDVLAVDDGREAFPAETFRVLNLTPVPLLARIGEKESEIKPGVSPVVRLADVLKPGERSVALALGMRTTDAGVLTLYLGPLEARANSRALALVLPPKVAGSRKVRVNVVTQTVAVPSK